MEPGTSDQFLGKGQPWEFSWDDVLSGCWIVTQGLFCGWFWIVVTSLCVKDKRKEEAPFSFSAIGCLSCMKSLGAWRSHMSWQGIPFHDFWIKIKKWCCWKYILHILVVFTAKHGFSITCFQNFWRFDNGSFEWFQKRACWKTVRIPRML